jgi:hypothetical protein
MTLETLAYICVAAIIALFVWNIIRSQRDM